MMTGKITILDGGMGRELEKRGAPFKQPEWSALAMMVAPESVKEVHKAFIASGASVIKTNSYALVPFHIGEKQFKDQGKALATCAGKTAREAVNETQTGIRIAGSIPPLFGSYRADLYRSERVVELASPLIEGLRTHVDLWLCETQSLIDEPIRIKSLIDRLDMQNKPFWVSFTLEDSQLNNEPLLRSGESVVDAVKAMVDANVDAILFNCCQPEVISQSVKITQHQLIANVDKALLRAYTWLYQEADFPAKGDDTWQPHVVNYYYHTAFAAPKMEAYFSQNISNLESSLSRTR